jgi:hypothetical protein
MPLIDGDELLDPRWHGAIIPIIHWHFHRRLLKRYGMVLGPGDFSCMVKAVKSGQATLIETRRTNWAIYSLRLNSNKKRIYILVRGNTVISAWPPNKRLKRLNRALTGSQQST